MGHGNDVWRKYSRKFGRDAIARRALEKKGATMRKIFTTVLGYVGAALTLVVAVTIPFVLMGYFSSVFVHAGFHVDDEYTGGTVARTVQRSAYQVAVYEPVYPHVLQSREPFVQIAFRPVNALPEQISEEVDLD